MKHIFLLLFLVSIMGFSCEKEDNESGSVLVNLHFTKTETPASTTALKGITSRVHCYGPDLCYKFSHFDIKQTAPFQFDIYAKGTYPKGNMACPQALYQVDTTININITKSGQYILKFYNPPHLFKSDTVVVN